MRLKHRLFYTAALLTGSTSAFVSPHQRTNLHNSKHNIERNILHIRGGDIISNMPSSSSALFSVITPVTEALTHALVSGTPLHAIGALYAVASLTVVPLTYYRTGYSFSVGYGLSVAAMSAALLSSFPKQTLSAPPILALTSLVYGLRLAAFIFVRERTVESKRKVFDEMNKKPVLQRTPLALGVALLYAFMVSPVLFALRGTLEAGSLLEKVQVFFTGLAAFGMVLESVADLHKYEVKRQSKDGDEKFVGPTTWSYKLCRHPNYLGEILHWFGLFGAGSVSFGKSIAGWTCGGLGLFGILSIMMGASSRLDTKQSEKYGGQPAYDEWKGKVTSSVIPFIK
eukprot:CAMPEP_0201884026 /NCGR_PEP_ID=MMETSP0902-20130614/16367_1 /ASSEMBLY_ACC=CAM_ASM_000551 /TAXON_ID=420261 /ORGANISM="Thalassiosira antarctica, Strain CCMP982" /LENGTH=340 /DNA_ID=CAMNT_0048412913 /DNA_START=42 /DNA_END=1064 /DNA_ORIENTATION=+